MNLPLVRRSMCSTSKILFKEILEEYHRYTNEYVQILPWKSRRITDMLALIVGGIIGPIAAPGFTTTTSKLISLASSQAAFSASAFDAEYHN